MSFLAFLLTATLLAITPGPGIAYVVARTAAGGRAEGLASCLGTGIGGFFHVVAAALGLSALIANSALAFGMVKYIGAVYLVYLGICMLIGKTNDQAQACVRREGARKALVEGIVVEALNVKTALFFLAFLPQFVLPSEPFAAQIALLGSICVVLNTLVDAAAVLVAGKLLKAGAARAARARFMTRTSGAVMVVLGMFLVLARQKTRACIRPIWLLPVELDGRFAANAAIRRGGYDANLPTSGPLQDATTSAASQPEVSGPSASFPINCTLGRAGHLALRGTAVPPRRCSK